MALPGRPGPGRQVHAERFPVVADQAHCALRADDGNGVAGFLAALVAVRVEVVEATLDVRDHALAVIEQDHGVVLGGHHDLALAVNGARRGNDAGHGDDRLGGPEQAGQGGEVVDHEIGHAAAALLVEER